MSDGPYKSLPMSRSWKRLAEFAQNENFEGSQISEAAGLALERDWRKNVSASLVSAVREVFCGGQSTLFAEQGAEVLRAIGASADRPLAKLFIDCAVNSIESGNAGERGLVEAVVDTLLGRAARGVRQVEEHFYRKSHAILAKSVRNRLEIGIGNSDLTRCARNLLKLDNARGSKFLRHDGLDEGVPI